MGVHNQSFTSCDKFVNLSDADETLISQYTYNHVQKQVKLYCLLIILTVGLFGNFGFLIVITRVRSMHTLINSYLVNLALADLIVLIENAALPLVYLVWVQVPSNGQFVGAAGCMTNIFFIYLGYFASITLVCLISTERFLAVCHPLKHHSINTKTRASKFIAGAWVLAIVLSIWAIPNASVHTKIFIEWPSAEDFISYPEFVGRCASPVSWTVYFLDALQTVPFFSALICNAVFFTKIIHKLRGRRAIDRENMNGRRIARITHQVTKMLVVNVVVFFICHAPFQILSMCGLIASLAGQELFSNPIAESFTLVVFQILVCMNSAVNPLVYNATNSRYRRAFIRGFTCSTRAKNVQHSLPLWRQTPS